VATIDMGRKEGGCYAPFAGSVTPSSTMWPGPRSTSVPHHAASSSSQPFGYNRHGPKLGGVGCALFLGVAGSTSNTMLRRPRPTSVPSGTVIHAAVWPQ